MAVYKYQPIDLDRPAVRLLRLIKGDFADDICCHLFNGWINQSDGGIPYDALSYTWGSTGMAARISVNDSSMYITLNLYEALRHLRLANEDRILWVDAICIDQHNLDERRHQVQQMSYIYKEAVQVAIWLGQGTEETDLIMDSMKRLQQNYGKVKGDWRLSAQLWMRENGPGEISRDYNAIWREGMELILSRPWFQRIWILQEVANARVATVYCGTKSVSARTFAQVPSIIGLKPKPHCQAVLDIMPGLSRKESWWRQNRNLRTLLLKFRESHATDERDTIYALLGISSDAFLGDRLFPDYRKSLRQVLQDTILFLLGHTNQDIALYKFLDWELPEFLQSLDSLSGAVLRSASRYGQKAAVKLLLAINGVDTGLKDNDGMTSLHWATQNGHEAVVKLLLEQGVEVELRNKMGWTPLFYASQNGNEAVVKLLLRQGVRGEARTKMDGADASLKDSDGMTPLHLAARNGHDGVVKLLLELGIEVEPKTKMGWTPLFYALQNGNEAVAKLLLGQGVGAKARIKMDRVDTSPKDSDGMTLLHLAARNGHDEVVKLLLELGIEVEPRTLMDWTPLFYASQNGHEAVAVLLLERGAKPNLKNNWGQTPLFYAAQNGHEAVAVLLLERGAKPNLKNNWGQTPLFYAAQNGHEAVAELLLERGAKLDLKNNWGQTLLLSLRRGILGIAPR